MEKTIDSTKQKLTMQDVIVRAVYNQEAEGLLDSTAANVLMLLTQELQMPKTDVLQLGNTVFITHYSEDREAAMMRALTVDTAKNMMALGEQYIRHLQNRGVKYFATYFQTPSYMAFFKEISRRNLGVWNAIKKNGQDVVIVKLKPIRTPPNVKAAEASSAAV